MQKEKVFTPLTSNNYKPLHTVVPLKTPLSVTFCSTQKCNFFCEFCYRYGADKSKLPSDSMTLNFFEKLAGDVADFDDKVEVVDVCGSGEPLLLPNIVEWIELLSDTKNINQLKMITNGTLLTPQKAEEVINAGLDLIVISINGLSDEGYSKIVHSKVNFNNLMENIKYLSGIKGKCKLHIKCIGDYFSDEELKRFTEMFSPLADTIHIDNAINQWLDLDLPNPPHKKAGSEDTVNRFGKNFEFQKKPMCNFPFYYMRIHTSGKVSSCATNWEDKMIIGDAKINSLKEIWNSIELNNLRLNLLKAEKTECVSEDCKNCKYYEMMTGEDLTPYKDELIKKYSE